MKMQSSKPRVTVQTQSGTTLPLTGKPAMVVQALIATKLNGLSRMDVQPWCWDLASAIRDIRAQLGSEAIQRIPGDRLNGLPCRYRLVEKLAIMPEAPGNGRRV